MIITNPFSIFHEEAELELNVQNNSLKKRYVKRPLQSKESSRAQHMGFALNRFERQDFAQSTVQSASRKRAGQLFKKLSLGKWPKATRSVAANSNVDTQLKKLKISYPNHTQSWRRATPNEQSSYLSRLQAKTRHSLQKVKEKCRTWRQAATRPQSGVNPQLLDKEASFRYINDSAHISRYEAHCKQSLLYKSYKSEFELSKNLHYLDAYLQEHFEQNLSDLPTSTGKSQSVGRISTHQRALMRQNMLKGDGCYDANADQAKSESRALMYEAKLGIDEQILNNYTQSDSLPSDSLSSSEYASVFSGLHAKTGSMEKEVYEGEVQFACLTSFPMLLEENRKLKLEYKREQRQTSTSTVVGNLLPKLDPNFMNLNLNVTQIEKQQEQQQPVREYKKKFETRARERERDVVDWERDEVDDVSRGTIDASLLAHNQNMADSKYYRIKSLQKQQEIAQKYDFQLRKTSKRDNKERVKMCENIEENIKAFEECNKIKYESYLEHFQRQQRDDVDGSYIYNYNNKLKMLKLKEQQRNSGKDIENFYDDTFVENVLTTENINADKREVTKNLCYMLTGEFTDPATGDVGKSNDWVVSDTLRTYDADKGSFVLSNDNQQQQQQQVNHQYGFYKQEAIQQLPTAKIKRKHGEKYKELRQQRQEVSVTPFLSAGVGNSSSSSRRSKSSNSSFGSRHFDDVDEHNDDYKHDYDVDDRYVVDTDSDDDNTKRNSFVNVFYSGTGYNVDAVAAITTTNTTMMMTTTTTTTAVGNKHAHSHKLSSTLTNSGRFNNFTDHNRYNEFYKRPLTNSHGAVGGSSLNSSTLSTTSSSSSTTSQQQQQQQQIKYFTPTYMQTKHATKYMHQTQKRERENTIATTTTTTTTSTIIGNYIDSRYTAASGDYFERFLIKKSTHENTNLYPSENKIPIATTTSTTAAKINENTPAFITALNYYGTGAAVDSLYAHSAYANHQQQQHNTNSKIEGSHYKQQQQQLSTSSCNTHAGITTTTTTTIPSTTTPTILQKRYQLMPNNTNNTTNSSASTSRPQGAGYVLEYEC